METQLPDTGSAFEALKQSSAVIGILYAVVVVQAGIIIRLWLKTEKQSETIVKSLQDQIDELRKRNEK